MKNLKRFITKSAILFLLATLIVPGSIKDSLAVALSPTLASKSTDQYMNGDAVPLSGQLQYIFNEDINVADFTIKVGDATNEGSLEEGDVYLCPGNIADYNTFLTNCINATAYETVTVGVTGFGGGTSNQINIDYSGLNADSDYVTVFYRLYLAGSTSGPGEYYYNFNTTNVCGNGVVENGEECDDGGTSDSDGCSATCTIEGPAVPMFISSASMNGILGGAAGADQTCQSLATDEGLGGTWQAVIQDSSRDLNTWLPQTPYVRAIDGTVISYNRGMFLSQANLPNSVLKTEFDLATSSGVWTGWDFVAGGNIGTNCTNWSSTSGTGEYGAADSTVSGMWLDYGDPSACGNSNALYCIQTALPAVCGNSSVEAGEQCDDGNTDAGDGCDSSCQVEGIASCFDYPDESTCTSDAQSFGNCEWDGEQSECVETVLTCGGLLDAEACGGAPYCSWVEESCVQSGGGFPAFVFTTSTSYNGNLGGILGANAKCQAVAEASTLVDGGLDGHWNAIISDPTHNVADILPDKPYMRLDWEIVADNKADLLDGSIINPMGVNEDGVSLGCSTSMPSPACIAWTGSLLDGTYATGIAGYSNLSCGAWDSSSGTDRAVAGWAAVTSADWLDGMPEDDGALVCDGVNPLYCFSADSSGPGEPPEGGFCGNGELDPGEECDGSALAGMTCADGGFTGGTIACTASCQIDFNACTGGTPNVCGNGTLEFPEQCDDGNLLDFDGCNQFCEWEGGAGDDCWDIDDVPTCDANAMCFWDFMAGPPGGMCVPDMISPCNSFLNLTSCENDPVCFWNPIMLFCEDNFGAGYPAMPEDEVYTFPQPFDNPNQVALTDGDPYGLGNRPDHMMEGIPRMWDVGMMPLVVGFPENHNVPGGQESDFVKLYRFDDLNQTWTDVTTNLEFIQIGPEMAFAPNTEEISLFAVVKDFLLPAVFAEVPQNSEILGVTIIPLDSNTVYRVAVSGVTKASNSSLFAGQDSACPDGSGNSCFTSTFKTGEEMMPTADGQFNPCANYANSTACGANPACSWDEGPSECISNFSGAGCVAGGDPLIPMWPFDGATNVDPFAIIDIDVCGDTDVSNAVAVLTNTDAGIEVPVDIFEGSLILQPVFPLAPQNAHTVEVWIEEGGEPDLTFSFNTGDMSAPGGQTFGNGQLTVNLVDAPVDGNPIQIGENGATVVIQCGEVPPMDPSGPPVPTENSFFAEGFIPGGSNSTIIYGIPTPADGQAFADSCSVFLMPDVEGIALSGQYAYAYQGGTTVDPTSYPQNDGSKPMPPGAKYAEVAMSDNPPDYQINLNLQTIYLQPGTLTGRVYVDLDGSDDYDAGEELVGAEVNMFTMGPPDMGSASQFMTISAADGTYSFPNEGDPELLGGSYMLEMWSDRYTKFEPVSINGDTTHDVVVGLGETLSLRFNGIECWDDSQSIFYDFFPVEWGFDTQPVFGELEALSGGTDASLVGFSTGSYIGHIEVPGCKPINELQITIRSELVEVDLDGGLATTGIVVNADTLDPIEDFFFGAHTDFTGGTFDFGGFVGTVTNGSGNFTMGGMDPGPWILDTEGNSYSFVSGFGDLPVDGVLVVPEGGFVDPIQLGVRVDKRVNITITDGVDEVLNAMIDIQCSNKFVHLGHSNNVWTYLPPGDTCMFVVNSWMGNYEPLQQQVVITPGVTPQDVILTLQPVNRNTGTYSGMLEVDRTTSYPGGVLNYLGHIDASSAASFAGHTITLEVPNTIPNANIIAFSPQTGPCSVSGGVATCTTVGMVDPFFDVFVELTIPTDFAGTSVPASLNVNSTPINIGNAFTSVVSLSINAPAFVDLDEQFTVYGQAYPNATVTLSRIDDGGTETTMGTTVMEPGSSWYSFADKSINAQGTHNLKVSVVAGGVADTATKEIEVGGTQAGITSVSFECQNGTMPVNPSTGLPSGQIFEGDSCDVSVQFDGDPLAGSGTSVYGTFLGVNYNFSTAGVNLLTSSIPQGWTGFGNVTFDLYLGTAGDPITYGPIAEVLILIDPSGYVYDTVDANRISGLTATVYQLVDGSNNTITFIDGADDGTGGGTSGNGTIEDGEELANSASVKKLDDGSTNCLTLASDGCHWATWSATPSGQVNPQTTDADGNYGWNVPQGWYRVAFQKTGAYSLSYSRDVYVPPAETTLNLDLGGSDIGAPTVSAVNPENTATGVARNATPVVTFSEPMLGSTITTTNVKLLSGGSPVSSTIAYDAGSYSATITPDATLAASTTYTIRVTTGVKDDSSNALASTSESTFTTGGVSDVVAPTSAATPAGATFTSAQSVTLGADDGGGAGTCDTCTIYYTTDGSAPSTSSSVYTGAIAISTTTTLKFFAKDVAGNSESANSETYTINYAAPGVPQGVTGGALVGGSSINWNDVTGADNYKVYRTLTSGSGYALLSSPATSLYADYNVSAGTTYYYKVSSVNGAGESGLSVEVSVTPTASTTTTTTTTSSGGGGGGGSSAPVNPPSDANDTTSVLSTKLEATVDSDKTVSRALQVEEVLILETETEKSAKLTTADGTITIKPNKDATVSVKIPASTTVTGSLDWDGKISPPLVKNTKMISSRGEVIDGTARKLMRNRVIQLVKVGSTDSILKFSNKVELEIPITAPDGTMVQVLMSEDGATWKLFDLGMSYMVMNGKIKIMTDTFSYFAFTEADEDAITAESDSPFTDTIGHWAQYYITEIANRGIAKGKSEDKFAPNDNITRAELTKMAVNAFNFVVPGTVTENPFYDVKKDAWYAPYVWVAKDNGIVEGIGNNNFAPNKPVTRAAALKILLEAAGFSDVASNFDKNYLSNSEFTYAFFPDVAVAEWFAKYVAYAKDFGIVGGYDDGKFKPGNNITRAEVAKVVVKILGMVE